MIGPPLVRVPSGYAQCTLPNFFPKAKKRYRQRSYIGNPLKVTAKTIELLSRANKKSSTEAAKIKELRLIDRRYAHPRVLSRIEGLLDRFQGDITIVVPDSHEHFLQSVASVEWVVDTTPYSAGLTAREALALGAKLLTPPSRTDFICRPPRYCCTGGNSCSGRQDSRFVCHASRSASQTIGTP